MELQDLTRALEQLISAQTTLLQLTTWLSALVLVLAALTFVGFLALFLELRSVRQMLVHIQSSAEHIAEMTRDVLRRV
jgi:hypothetical protein